MATGVSGGCRSAQRLGSCAATSISSRVGAVSRHSPASSAWIGWTRPLLQLQGVSRSLSSGESPRPVVKVRSGGCKCVLRVNRMEGERQAVKGA